MPPAHLLDRIPGAATLTTVGAQPDAAMEVKRVKQRVRHLTNTSAPDRSDGPRISRKPLGFTGIQKATRCLVLAIFLAASLAAWGADSPTPGGHSGASGERLATPLGWSGALEAPACRVGGAFLGTSLARSAQQVFRDPASGRFAIPPPGLAPVGPKAVAAPARPLVEHAVTVPGGGVRVDLGDRYSTALVVTREPSGELLRTECAQDPLHAPGQRQTKADGGDR